MFGVVDSTRMLGKIVVYSVDVPRKLLDTLSKLTALRARPTPLAAGSLPAH